MVTKMIYLSIVEDWGCSEIFDFLLTTVSLRDYILHFIYLYIIVLIHGMFRNSEKNLLNHFY